MISRLTSFIIHFFAAICILCVLQMFAGHYFSDAEYAKFSMFQWALQILAWVVCASVAYKYVEEK